ncbi:MAG: NAD-dependent epimerase/dehydratase family protein [Marmoricola sp.]
MARVLITGSTGLLGRWTLAHWPAELEAVEALHDEHDLTDARAFVALVRATQADVVLHLAWCASGTPNYRTSNDNERWTESSLQAARYCMKEGVRFIATGTVVDTTPGSDRYATAKHELRTHLQREIAEESIAWIRPFYVFDPVARRPALVADCLEARSAGRTVELRSPHSKHDFIHASDVGEAMVQIISHGLAGVIDVGSGVARTVRDLASACGAVVADHVGDGRPAAEVVADTSELAARGWRPRATTTFFAGAQ